MKKMQDFHKMLSSKDMPLTARERCLTAVAHLNRAQVDLFATSDPWLIWSANSNMVVA